MTPNSKVCVSFYVFGFNLFSKTSAFVQCVMSNGKKYNPGRRLYGDFDHLPTKFPLPIRLNIIKGAARVRMDFFCNGRTQNNQLFPPAFCGRKHPTSRFLPVGQEAALGASDLECGPNVAKTNTGTVIYHPHKLYSGAMF